MAYALSPEFQNNPIKVMIPFFAVGLFICCMVCHGELARLKPHPSRLTFFYVMIALGGALGGVFVALIAPRVFAGFYELPMGLAACAFVVLAVLRADPESGLGGRGSGPSPLAAALCPGGGGLSGIRDPRAGQRRASDCAQLLWRLESDRRNRRR